jgi:hypothetical protein
MGWERRRGRMYYYRKVRRGGRIISQYRGSGELGQLAALLAETEHAEAQARRALLRAERQVELSIDREIDQAIGITRDMVAATWRIMSGPQPRWTERLLRRLSNESTGHNPQKRISGHCVICCEKDTPVGMLSA